MHRLRFLITSLITLCLFIGAVAGATEQLPTVAVLDFESIGSEEYLGKAVAEIIRTELVGTRNYRVVERSQINRAVEEQELRMSGMIDDQSAVEIGKLLGADLIVVGSVVRIGNAYTINSRMIDVETGEAQLGRNVTGTDLNLLTDMSRELITVLFRGGEPAHETEEPKLVATEETRPVDAEEPKGPVAEPTTVTWDFETGDLTGWEAAGDAFLNQPTYGDNPTERRRGQPSMHQGDYWIGGFEFRKRPSDPPGRIQGDAPQGTLTSAPFLIDRPTITFLVGGGCDKSKVRVELLVEGQVVRTATGRCRESMTRERWDVAPFQGKTAEIRLVDQSGGGWGHLNFDDLRFEGDTTPRKEYKPGAVHAKPAHPPQQEITWDFETGDLRGWHASGPAFAFQPTYGDNPTARRRAQPSKHQGDYWIGGFEKRRGPEDPAGGIQGDRPRGVLTSEPFTIGKGFITFLIGGGCDAAKVRAELVIGGRVVRTATGECNETMKRRRWDVREFRGKSAVIRLVDASGGGWGHLNFDDVGFE